VTLRSLATWNSFCSAAYRVSGDGLAAVSPRWFVREDVPSETIEKRRLEASVVVGAADRVPAISLAALDALVSREFPGVGQDKIAVEALWSCSESGPSLALAPRYSLGAVLRITGPTDEPDGYREIPPA